MSVTGADYCRLGQLVSRLETWICIADSFKQFASDSLGCVMSQQQAECFGNSCVLAILSQPQRTKKLSERSSQTPSAWVPEFTGKNEQVQPHNHPMCCTRFVQLSGTRGLLVLDEKYGQPLCSSD